MKKTESKVIALFLSIAGVLLLQTYVFKTLIPSWVAGITMLLLFILFGIEFCILMLLRIRQDQGKLPSWIK